MAAGVLDRELLRQQLAKARRDVNVMSNVLWYVYLATNHRCMLSIRAYYAHHTPHVLHSAGDLCIILRERTTKRGCPWYKLNEQRVKTNELKLKWKMENEDLKNNCII
jgi:hypothetical protein